ncbi:Type I restriction modification system specificity (S) subunit, HsdS [Mycoplasmopsis bovigenitalium 51080]|uniref:Type I restriction modification system specificity (S) subunit, HsdS n=1 Tax=Mycoplasmopsis bovigenitalium 51080 TaxID=1188235 RepID=N9VFJ4_9BACT|nr:restriction endonuclease subunit S [Mycoplasmopsis bovigenitalium]ENY70141.1 Type I restriction modification system specificity (S) subunit, HsdS [Mycoplasmopsis bovigenitalium 51080]
MKAMSGGTPNTDKADYYNGNIPFLSIADMTKQQKYIENTTKQISNLGLKNSSCWLVPANSLLLSIYASLGKTAINKANIATSQAILGIILKDLTEIQFYYYLLTKMENKKYWYKYISLGTQPNLSLSTVEESLIFNTELEEKIKIGNVFESLDTLITLHQHKSKNLKTLKSNLIKIFI